MSFGLLDLPPPVALKCLSAINVRDVVAFGLSCRAAAAFVFAERCYEWREAAGVPAEAAAEAPPETTVSDAVPGGKPIISCQSDIPQCVRESWKLWQALCDLQEWEVEPHRSPLMVARHV